MKLKSLIWTLGIKPRTKRYGTRALRFTLPVEGEIEFEKWQPPLGCDCACTQTLAAAGYADQQHALGNSAIPNTESAAAYFFALLKGQYFLRMTLGVPPIPSKSEMLAHVKEVVAIFMRLYGGRNPMITKCSL
jgi:hypothetical protein